MQQTNEDLLSVKPPKKFIGIRTSAWVEIFAFFIILTFISYLSSLPFNFFNVSPHPFWIVVVLMAAQYGTLEGLLAAFIATLFLSLGPLRKGTSYKTNPPISSCSQRHHSCGLLPR